MQKQNFKNSIVSFVLIVSTILMPLSFLPQKVEAQSVSGYTSGIGTAITQLPQCQDVSLKTKLLFTGAIGALGGAINGGNLKSSLIGAGVSAGTTLLIDSLTPKLTKVVEDAATSIDSISTHDVSANDKLDTLNTKADKTLNNVSSLKDNSTCTAAIGRIVTKMLLQKITRSTIDWIKSGFDGSPTFIQDPGKFFGDIAKNELLQFGGEISNPQLFPFGKAWMKNTASAFNNKFQDNASYSLNKLIQDTNPEYSAITFQQDFSQGGWDAWTAMTQVPANNPLGFKLMADNEIQKRLAGTTQSTAQAVHEALSQANGFLGDQRCTDPKGVTKQEDSTGRVERSNHPNNDPDPRVLKYIYLNRVCNQWKYVTPGSMIADAATSTMTTTKDSLLVAQDLNDAIAAVADALLAHFSSDLMEKGFTNIQTEDLTGLSDLSSSTYQSQTQKDYQPSQLSSSWLQANPEFDIRTGLTQALIDEQRTYSDKLALQNKELMSTTDGKDYNIIGGCPSGWTGTYPNCTGPIRSLGIGFTRVGEVCPSGWTPNPTYPNCKGPDNPATSNAYGLMPAIYQLDYCIPGPHPGWEDDSQRTLMDMVVPKASSSSSNTPSLFVSIVSSIPIIGGILGSIFGSSDDAYELSMGARMQYSQFFTNLTGFILRVERKGDSLTPQANNVTSNSTIVQVFNRILSRYIEIMDKTYFSSIDKLPAVAKEATVYFGQLKGYGQMIKNNEDKIALLKGTINTLGDIKKEVDKLNIDYPNGEDQYESKLKVQINAFGRLSSSMVNGDDIASADNLYKQIVDKKVYIYNNLLKGPYGCEAFLQNLDNVPPSEKNFPSANPGVKKASNDWNNYNVNSVKRMTYPFPILYDYNVLAKGGPIPDPWKSGFVNKMPLENKYDQLGPGFLSFVYFTKDDNIKDWMGAERLNISDLVDTYGCETKGSRDISLGLPLTMGTPNDCEGTMGLPNAAGVHPSSYVPTSKTFENTIGIY